MSGGLPFPLNQQVDAIVPYEPGKPTEELERELGLTGTVKLASNENALGPSPRAVEAMAHAARRAHRYPDGGGFYLKRRLAQDVGLSPDHLILGNGSTEIVEMLAKACLPPSGEALVAQGAFIMYKIAALAASARVRSIPMTDDLRHDLSAMARAVGPDTRLVFIANPNNPTGTRVSRAELEAYVRSVPERVLTVVDEAYREYIDDPDYPDALEHLRRGRRLVILRTFSKIYGLAGVRIGYALADPDVIRALEKVRSPFNTNSIGQAGALAALDDAAHRERSRRENQAQRDRLQRALGERGIPHVPSSANFVLAATGLPGREAFRRLLAEGVIVRPVDGYGFPDHVRISVGTGPEVDRLLASLDRVRRGAGLISA